MVTETGTMVPPRRLGALLRNARVAAGLELEQLASRTDLTTVDLDDLEHGRRLVDDALLESLIELYGVQGVGLLPARSQLVIDLDEGRIAVDQAELEVGELTGPDAVLARYLALVYQLRELRVGTPIHLRDVDLKVLGTALELAADDVELRLRRLMADEDTIAHDQKRIRRRMLIPLVGVVVAACSSGVILLVAESNEVESPDPAPAETAAELAETSGGEIATPTVATAVVETDLGNGAAVAEAPVIATELGTAAVVVNPEG